MPHSVPPPQLIDLSDPLVGPEFPNSYTFSIGERTDGQMKETDSNMYIANAGCQQNLR